ncbi:DUF551 domain-containing protein [Escherichia coli]|uniref:DUF551 domain-containing protein n=1 Tax=Escherichia coli TaxID=562 RepID=UPI0029F36D63|nr:DUF551 domain-containing protein [Escherichia coli]MCE4255653.1 DUF551 domain-containing protein [Escherichia coli]MCE4375725.1 DUF551 domain-containing protein [Escherichia coli]MCE4388897.1 DUF551 domain-containing protein [Escherichia coli]MCE4395752.1 DUF551 domain-containing protein [Escherichia coli]MCE4413860.1 DUF551 domain-containing protein [Escherichia coli]
MTTITREQALKIIEAADEVISALAGTNEDVHPGSDNMLRLWDDLNDRYAPPEVVRELARIALASLEAEPIGEVSEKRHGLVMDGTVDLGGKSTYRIIKGEKAMKLLPLGTKFYIAPPAPVIQADVAQAIENLKQKLVECNLYNYCADAVKGVEYACHAAMLQGSQPVSQTYKLNELSGNYPVTPDGWISCSERMPEKGQNVLISVNFDSSLVEPLICSARYTGSTFRRGDATIKPGNVIEQATHWMPLPEPPQEVNRG